MYQYICGIKMFVKLYVNIYFQVKLEDRYCQETYMFFINQMILLVEARSKKIGYFFGEIRRQISVFRTYTQENRF